MAPGSPTRRPARVGRKTSTAPFADLFPRNSLPSRFAIPPLAAPNMCVNNEENGERGRQMRQGIGEEHGHGLSAQLTRARAEARLQLDEPDLVRALRTVRKEVRPLAQKLREVAPETFEAHRDALAVLLNDCALALVD